MAKTPEEKAAEKAAKEQAKAEAKAAKEAAKAAEKAAAEGSVTVKYRNHKGEVVSRTFSEEVHGDNFVELAEEFKATNATRIVV